jgi:hypothetical protein
MGGDLYRVVAPHFVAGIDVEDGIIVAAAPILGYARGRHIFWFVDYCLKKGWEINKLEVPDEQGQQDSPRSDTL